jgi:hypothetical protein
VSQITTHQQGIFTVTVVSGTSATQGEITGAIQIDSGDIGTAHFEKNLLHPMCTAPGIQALQEDVRRPAASILRGTGDVVNFHFKPQIPKAQICFNLTPGTLKEYIAVRIFTFLFKPGSTPGMRITLLFYVYQFRHILNGSKFQPSFQGNGLFCDVIHPPFLLTKMFLYVTLPINNNSNADGGYLPESLSRFTRTKMG